MLDAGNIISYLRLPFINVGSFSGYINLLSPLQGPKNLIEELGAIFISLFQNGKYQIILLGEEPSNTGSIH